MIFMCYLNIPNYCDFLSFDSVSKLGFSHFEKNGFRNLSSKTTEVLESIQNKEVNYTGMTGNDEFLWVRAVEESKHQSMSGKRAHTNYFSIWIFRARTLSIRSESTKEMISWESYLVGLQFFTIRANDLSNILYSLIIRSRRCGVKGGNMGIEIHKKWFQKTSQHANYFAGTRYPQ